MTPTQPLFVDANVFVRYFAQDHPDDSPRATGFIERAAHGEIEITTSESVLVEIVYVLSSPRLPYQLDRPTMARALRAILDLEGLRLPASSRTTYDTAIAIYEQLRIDFTDALSIAHVLNGQASAIVSFDRDFDRDPRVRRREP